MRLRIPALAKLNLALEVLHKREDGYHELRTVFQTISLCDYLEVEFTASSSTSIILNSDLEIPDNLATRAAHAFLAATGITGSVRLRLDKRIPMGGGLGGGSSDAAAVLSALVKLTGVAINRQSLIDLAASLGSDVPFFLLGGTVLATGRGTELYPLQDATEEHVLLVTPAVHSATEGAYASLNRTLEYRPEKNVCAKIVQALALREDWTAHTSNDFETAIFRVHPEIASVHSQLMQSEARVVRMTGSGAALFAVYHSSEALRAAQAALGNLAVYPVRFVGRDEYLLRLN